MIRQSTSVVLLPDWQFVCLSVYKYSAFMQALAFLYSYLVRCLDDVDYSKKNIFRPSCQYARPSVMKISSE